MHRCVRLFHASARRCAIREIRQLGDPVLRVPAQKIVRCEFGSESLKNLVTDLIETMRVANGAGIAAPQIGVSKSVFIVECTGKNPRYPYIPDFPLTVFVNPQIRIIDPTLMDMSEGCLSVPGFRGKTKRACRIEVMFQDVEGRPFLCVAEGHGAATLQHENDHLEAKLFTDQAGAVEHGLMTWASFDKYHRDAYVAHAMELNKQYPTPPHFLAL